MLRKVCFLPIGGVVFLLKCFSCVLFLFFKLYLVEEFCVLVCICATRLSCCVLVAVRKVVGRRKEFKKVEYKRFF